jgi:hypothetical protein
MSVNDENQMIDTSAHKPKKKTARKFRLKKPPMNWKVILTITIVAISIGTAAYFWNEARNTHNQSPETVATKNQEESDKVVESLGKILYLDGDSKPTVARIENPEILRNTNAEFYKNTQAGDYLVLYPNRAIIYRLSENQIINFAPIINTSQITPDQQQ